eukprot:COSAG04_NODE_1267_length_7479_cov_16.387398_9_plen_294_part_00
MVGKDPRTRATMRSGCEVQIVECSASNAADVRPPPPPQGGPAVDTSPIDRRWAQVFAAGAASAPIEIRIQGGRCFRIQGQPWRDEEGYSVCRVLWFDAESAGEGADSAGDDDIVFDDDEGSGAVDASEEDEEASLALAIDSEALAELVAEWSELVKSGGHEKQDGQLKGVLADLGPMPEPPGQRAMWVAALINPLPGLGVAYEIRPAMLDARSVEERSATPNDPLRSSATASCPCCVGRSGLQRSDPPHPLLVCNVLHGARWCVQDGGGHGGYPSLDREPSEGQHVLRLCNKV